MSFGMGIHSSRRSFPSRHGGTGMTRSRKWHQYHGGRQEGWKSLFRACPFVKWCVLTWSEGNWQKKVEWGSVTGCPIPFSWRGPNRVNRG